MNNGKLNQPIELKRHKLDQTDARYIRKSVDKRAAFSKKSFAVSEEKPDEDKCNIRDNKQHIVLANSSNETAGPGVTI